MTELAAVAAIYPHIKNIEAEVLAISTDSAHSHQVFKQITPAIKEVGFPLVSDRTHEISQAYRVLDQTTGAAYRASFFISPDQIIHAKMIYPKAIGRNIPEHFRLLQALQYNKETGQGVPANWVQR
jgi:NADH-dependent peroxiredoxin subunit C